jgi:dephospho-CoA kinase
MKLVAITGMPGSGKDTVRGALEERGFVTVTMRHVVQQKLEEQGVEVDNRNLRELASKLREEGGPAIIAELCVPLVREYDEVEKFRELLKEELLLVAVFAPPKLRFERLKNRGETWDMKTWEEFAWRDRKELGWGLGGAIAMADVTLSTAGGADEFRRAVDVWTESLEM